MFKTKTTATRKTRALLVLTLTATLAATLLPRSADGCGVNFEKMRKRRIEAIRGQILSKLGFTHLPSEELPPPDSLTREVEALYNRTRDFVLDEARRKRESCLEPEDSYYAQDITTVYMQNPQEGRGADREPGEPAPRTHERHQRQGTSGSPSPLRYKQLKMTQGVSEFFDFDLTQTQVDPDMIVSASLRFYQVPNHGAMDDSSEKVELCQLSLPQKEGKPPVKRFLQMRQMDTSDEGWVTFDVTSSVREWIQFPSLNQGLELTVPCQNEGGSFSGGRSNAGIRQKLNVYFAGSSKVRQIQGTLYRGDSGRQTLIPELGKEYNPHLVIMVRTPTPERSAKVSSNRRRKKRELDAEYCFRRKPSETNCCLRELYIDFRKDLNWNWIHAPSGYKANFCGGACPYMWSADTQYSTILALYKTMNPQASSAPCCTPKDLDPLTLMYYQNGSYKFINMSDMVLLSCKCR